MDLQSKDLKDAKSELGIHWAVTAITHPLFTALADHQHRLQRDQPDISEQCRHSLTKCSQSRNMNINQLHLSYKWDWIGSDGMVTGQISIRGPGQTSKRTFASNYQIGCEILCQER